MPMVIGCPAKSAVEGNHNCAATLLRRKGRGMDKKKAGFFILVLICALIAFPLVPRSEIYKYVDKSGTIHFVDDLGKVPEEYRDQITVYEDKPEAAPEEETPTVSEDETPTTPEGAEEKAGEESDEALIRQRELEEQQRQEEEQAREELESGLVTPVVIEGNHVLVPVTLGYIGYEVQATLVLDTGADIMTIHRQIADQLHLPLTKRAKVQVTGGKSVDARLAQLDYARVGPYEAQDIHTLIILHQGSPVPHDGLLGMNFLRGLEYSIDFDNQVIRWRP
jgi:predicted aspartyl protease